MVGESLRPIVTQATTFRHATYADMYRHGGALYTVVSPATSANA